MSEHYFACDWIIRDVGNFKIFDEIYDKAKELNCHPVNLTAGKFTDEGYVTITYGICAASSDALHSFIEQAGYQIGLTNWYPIAKEIYDQGNEFERLSIIDPLNTGNWIDAFLSIAHYNDQIRNRDKL